MIVQRRGGRQLLITQPDHAALAREIMAGWLSLQTLARRDAILLAVGEHDNGWQEPDAAPQLDADGRVVDFLNAPDGIRQAVWPRAVSRLGHEPWAAALVAQHAVTVYARFRSAADWTAFFVEMEELRDTCVAASGVPADRLLEEYAFVRIGDLLSLAFCNRWTDVHEYGGFAIRLAGDRLSVTPDPFGGREVAFQVGARELPDEPLASDESLREALLGAPTVSLRGVASGREQG